MGHSEPGEAEAKNLIPRCLKVSESDISLDFEIKKQKINLLNLHIMDVIKGELKWE